MAMLVHVATSVAANAVAMSAAEHACQAAWLDTQPICLQRSNQQEETHDTRKQSEAHPGTTVHVPRTERTHQQYNLQAATLIKSPDGGYQRLH